MPNKTKTKNSDKILIFDFDGVIADSGAVFLETLEEVLGRPKPFSQQEVEVLRQLSTREIIKKLGIKRWQLPRIIYRGKQGVARRMAQVKLHEAMSAVIKTLSQDYPLYIVSTNSQQAIRTLLAAYKLEGCIVDIYAGSGLLNKAKRIQALMRKHKLAADQCIYIGDETRDIEAARQTDIQAVAVGWGYSAPAALQAQKPDAFVTKPAELPQAVANL